MAAENRLSIVCEDRLRGGDATLTWRGWTLSDDRTLATHHFVGVMAIPEVPARINLHIELAHSGAMTGYEPVSHDDPIVVEMPRGTPREFRIESIYRPPTDEEPEAADDDDEDDSAAGYVPDQMSLLCKDADFFSSIICFAIHTDIGPVLWMAGSALLAWHLMTNEWREGNAVLGDPWSVERKAWTPAPEGEVIELSQVTAATVTMEDRLVIRGETLADMYSSERPRLMAPEGVLMGLTRKSPDDGDDELDDLSRKRVERLLDRRHGRRD